MQSLSPAKQVKIKIFFCIREHLDAALKTNESLYFAVMTGCLRISKESIFTGLNNLKIYSLLDAECDERFGFTDTEVRQILDFMRKILKYGIACYKKQCKVVLEQEGFNAGQ